MKILTIKQPYATLLLEGIKRYETRTFNAKYRGLVAIHSSVAKMKPGEIQLIESNCKIDLSGLVFPLGQILGIGNLEDAKYMHNLVDMKFLKNNSGIFIDDIPYTERSLGNWISGNYAWVFNDFKTIETIPYKGRLGLSIMKDKELSNKLQELYQKCSAY